MSSNNSKNHIFDYSVIHGTALDYAFIESVAVDQGVASEVAAKANKGKHTLSITVNGVAVDSNVFLRRFEEVVKYKAKQEIRERLKQQIADVLDPFEEDNND